MGKLRDFKTWLGFLVVAAIVLVVILKGNKKDIKSVELNSMQKGTERLNGISQSNINEWNKIINELAGVVKGVN